MQRQNRTPFPAIPERTTTDNDGIELVNVNELDDAHESTPSAHCFAFEYASAPFIAATNAIRESIAEADVYINPETLYQRAANIGEYVNSTLAAPIAYGSAAVVSIFGFFGGAARDAYELANRYANPHDEEENSNNNPSP